MCFFRSITLGYFTFRSPTYAAMFAMRGFQVNGKTDEAVKLMKQTKVYPLAKISSPVPMEFINGSKQNIDTLFPDNFHFFELLPKLVDEEPLEVFGPLERSQMQTIGIEKDDERKALSDEAARLGGAMARANTYGPPSSYFYPDRKWQGGPEGNTYLFKPDGAPQIDARNNVYYMAAGNSPAMMAKNVGKGSQYLWTYHDANGDYLDGAKTYNLHVLPDIPAENFWSIVVYDSLSGSELQNGQRLPSVSQYTNPVVNTDGSIDVVFGPDKPKEKINWIRTVPGKGWFPIFRFYSPTEAYFDKKWKLEDIAVSPERATNIFLHGEAVVSCQLMPSALAQACTICSPQPRDFKDVTKTGLRAGRAAPGATIKAVRARTAAVVGAPQ